MIANSSITKSMHKMLMTKIQKNYSPHPETAKIRSMVGVRQCALLGLTYCLACGSSQDNEVDPMEQTSGLPTTHSNADSPPENTIDPTDDSSGPWRPFSDDSPWNTPIPEDSELHPNSDALIDDLDGSSKWNWLGINIDRFSIPVFEAQENTPRVHVEVRDIPGYLFDMQVPIPDDAMPDAESDHHLCIIDRKSGLEWGLWDAWKDSDGWHCGVGAAIKLDGSGVRPPKDGNQDWKLSHGARACGFPLIAGLIRVEEIRAGRIDHALVLAYPHIRSRYYTSPASTAQGTFGTATPDDDGIPCGGRVQLNPHLDLDALGLSDSGKTIAKALQEYGAYVADYSGAINLYAENSPEAREIWESGLLDDYEIREQIDLQELRVLKWGTLYDDEN